MNQQIGRIVRFGLVGVVNTGVYYGCYLLFCLALPVMAAHVLAFAVAMVGSYFLSCYFTFRTKPTWRKFLLFPLSNATNFVISTAGLYLLVHLVDMDSRIAPLVAAATAIPFTYLVARLVLVNRTVESELTS